MTDDEAIALAVLHSSIEKIGPRGWTVFVGQGAIGLATTRATAARMYCANANIAPSNHETADERT